MVCHVQFSQLQHRSIAPKPSGKNPDLTGPCFTGRCKSLNYRIYSLYKESKNTFMK